MSLRFVRCDMTREEKIRRIVSGAAFELAKNQEAMLEFVVNALLEGTPGLVRGTDETVDSIYSDYKEKGIVE